MKNKFSVRNVIANNPDPRAESFMCGSVISVGCDGYWIRLLGCGSAKIFFDEAIPLSDALTQHSDVLIVAEKNAWDEETRFIGGVIYRDDFKARKYIVKIMQGFGYIQYENSLLFKGRLAREKSEEDIEQIIAYLLPTLCLRADAKLAN